MVVVVQERWCSSCGGDDEKDPLLLLPREGVKFDAATSSVCSCCDIIGTSLAFPSEEQENEYKRRLFLKKGLVGGVGGQLRRAEVLIWTVVLVSKVHRRHGDFVWFRKIESNLVHLVIQ